ncbi:integrase, catalytic region, zinc finger, CCHC-type containing protein [Tanacetum coccineum]
MIQPNINQPPRPQKEEDHTGDDLKQYEADIKAMHLILISIPNDIYNSGTELSDIDRESLFNNEFDQFTTAADESLTNQAVMQADRVNIQSINVGNGGRISRRSYNIQEESSESSNVQKETGNVQRTLRTSSLGNATNVQCYNYNAKGHYERDCPKPRNDFLLADAAQMEEIKELSANICMMIRIQQANTDSDEGPSYDSTFISEVQTPSPSFMNSLFSKSDHEQTYHEQPKIINSTNGDDQINNDIIFDDPNVEINDGKVEHDKNAHDQ